MVTKLFIHPSTGIYTLVCYKNLFIRTSRLRLAKILRNVPKQITDKFM